MFQNVKHVVFSVYSESLHVSHFPATDGGGGAQHSSVGEFDPLIRLLRCVWGAARVLCHCLQLISG